MRCIETKKYIRTLAHLLKINYNMRCIETLILLLQLQYLY